MQAVKYLQVCCLYGLKKQSLAEGKSYKLVKSEATWVYFSWQLSDTTARLVQHGFPSLW